MHFKDFFKKLKMKKIQLLPVLFIISTINLYPQLSSHEFGGYVSDMPYIMYQSYGDSNDVYQQNILHNRLKYKWYANDKFTFNIEMRNQFLWGDNVNNNYNPKGFETENYFLPLSFYGHTSGNSLFYSVIDRANITYTKGDFETVAGRQRINWGQTFAFNPNDIFNSYNFFDFDYPEKPGADAIKLQYYTGYTSSLQLAAKIDSGNNVTAAAMYKFNKWKYDVQLMSGFFSYDSYSLAFDANYIPYYKPQNHQDIFFGTGWSGDFFGLSFRGELSYFQPAKNFLDTSGVFLSSFAFDYTFTNEMYISAEFLYQQNDSLALSDFASFYTNTRNAKTLSDFKYNLVAQMSYPLTPILNFTFAGMYFWQDDFKGIYVFPSIALSTSDNTEFAVMYQFFSYKDKLLTYDKWLNTQIGFLRFKWSF